MITVPIMRATCWKPLGRANAASLAVAVVLLSGCLGPPPMAPLTDSALKAAEQRWAARGSDSYHLTVRIRAPKLAVRDYEVDVSGGVVVRVARGEETVPPGDAGRLAYTVPGLFALLREDLALVGRAEGTDEPPIDLRALFDPETGRLIRYRRTVGSDRRRVLLLEVIDYKEVGALHSGQHPLNDAAARPS